jgi:hypothetical protein
VLSKPCESPDSTGSDVDEIDVQEVAGSHPDTKVSEVFDGSTESKSIEKSAIDPVNLFSLQDWRDGELKLDSAESKGLVPTKKSKKKEKKSTETGNSISFQSYKLL